jgi:hypothetical protein
MKRLALIFLAFSLALAAPAAAQDQSPPPDVPHKALMEILRRGDHVEHIVPGEIREEEVAYGQIMAPPPDDSHKWFISVVTTPGCAPCAKLKSDWRASPDLLAFANPGDTKNSWAHLNWFSHRDATQQFRWAGIRFESLPTIIIQPPMNGRYGNPKTVVAQITGYNGDPRALADDLRARFRFYLEKVQERRATEEATEQAAPEGVEAIGQAEEVATEEEAIEEEGIGQEGRPVELDPPFVVPPRVDPLGPLGPSPINPPPNPLAPPDPGTSDPSLMLIVSLVFKLFTTWISGGSLASLLQTAGILIITIIQYVKFRKFNQTLTPAPETPAA